MAPDKLTFYFDFTCPYSYIGWELLQKIRQTRPFELTLVGIGPNPPGNPRLLGRAFWSDDRWAGLKKLGNQLGLTIERPHPKATSTVARRGLALYEGSALPEYVSGVFRACFRDQVDISNPHTLVEHLQTNGIDPKPLAHAIVLPETLRKAEDDMLSWGHERIRTLPTLRFGQERLAGLFDQRGIDGFLSLMEI
ncbi:MAG TPA: DsbA family protein [Candidatus Ozemobacteraceae bacterium]